MARRRAVSIEERAGVLVLSTPYDLAFIEALKSSIPSPDRRWVPDEKVWLVAANHGQVVVELIRIYLGQDPGYKPGTPIFKPEETRNLDVRYIGAAKDRGQGNWASFGWEQETQDWTVVFPEAVLRCWFKADQRPDEAPTFYAVLGLGQSIDEPTIKKAYRRLARQWHPDMCKEPEAAEMFMTVKKAYDVLSNPLLRSKYDAGLKLAATLDSRLTTYMATQGYRSPLRCGIIMARGREQLGYFIVEEILSWDEIKDEQGRALVTTWPPGAREFISLWINLDPENGLS